MDSSEAKNYDLPLEIFIERYQDEEDINLNEKNLKTDYISYHLEANGIIGKNKIEFFNILLEKDKFSFEDILEICRDTSHLIEEDNNNEMTHNDFEKNEKSIC